jgi:hypothetical protein
MRRLVHILGLGLLAAIVVAAPVSAGKPEIERVPIDDLFVDEFLSEVCGAEVTVHFTGHVIFRVFMDADGNPVRELHTFALGGTYESANGTVHVRDVGADRIAFLQDGSLIQVVIGNVRSFNIPGQGRVYADVGRSTIHITFDANGDPTFTLISEQGQHDDSDLDALCSVLG